MGRRPNKRRRRALHVWLRNHSAVPWLGVLPTLGKHSGLDQHVHFHCLGNCKEADGLVVEPLRAVLAHLSGRRPNTGRRLKTRMPDDYVRMLFGWDELGCLTHA